MVFNFLYDTDSFPWSYSLPRHTGSSVARHRSSEYNAAVTGSKAELAMRWKFFFQGEAMKKHLVDFNEKVNEIGLKKK